MVAPAPAPAPASEDSDEKAERLRLDMVKCEADETTASAAVDEAVAAIAAAEANLAAVTAAMGSGDDPQSKALAEVAAARSKVSDATKVVDEAEAKFRRLGGGGPGNSSDADAKAGAPAAAEPNVDGSALEKLSEKDLSEVRKLPNPPPTVKKALELIQTILDVADGKELRDAKVEVPWSELQRMIAASDFIRKVGQIKPVKLSHNPELLKQVGERYPALKEAVGTTQAKRDPKAALKAAALKAKLAKGGGAAAPSEEAASKPNKFRAAVAAAAAESKASGGSEVTVEAVEYASRPCGAIFRFIANCINLAFGMAKEREGALAELEEAKKARDGMQQELDAKETFLKSLDAEGNKKAEAHKKAEAELAAANDKRLDAKVVHSAAVKALEEAKKAYEAAMRQAEADAKRNADNAERAKERAGKEAEEKRKQQEAMDKELANRNKPDPDLVWVREHSLSDPSCRQPVEFSQLGSAALPAEAAQILVKVASELKQCVSLKLHIAGHVQADEDPKLASQRAQAVGGALIALGVLPLRLRAKGYGAAIQLSKNAIAKLKLKSPRRVTLHALSEVCTKYGCEFAEGATNLSESNTKLLAEVAKLLKSVETTMRLSVEAHTDNNGEPSENAKLSMARAMAVVSHLTELGVEQKRLIPHGFGDAFPCDDNSTDAGRQRNRRVEFIVVPDETALRGEVKD